MKIPELLEDLAIVSQLGDNPGSDDGLSAEALKAKFDEAALKIQKYINTVLIPAINPAVIPKDYFAPAGYGLGVDAPSITLSDCNDATKSGWYRTSGSTANQPVSRGNWMRVDAFSSTYLCQTWFNDQYDGCTATRFKIGDNKWTPWEWVNPPMALGVEYRTTERWNGKPVYTMMANIGALPNNTGKTTDGGPLPMGITPISAYGIGLNGKTGAVIPSGHIYLSVYGEWGTVYINTDSDYSNYTGYIIVKYVRD